MMMRCVEAGGIPSVKGKERNKMASDQNGWQMNPGDDLYELHPAGLSQPWRYEFGKCIKVPIVWLHQLKDIPMPCNVVFMHRDPEEVAQSYRAVYEKDDDSKIPKMTAEDVTLLQMWGPGEWHRRGARVVEVDYHEVLDSPVPHMRILERNGWPIDAERAAAIVDPKQYRFRKERLVVGL